MNSIGSESWILKEQIWSVNQRKGTYENGSTDAPVVFCAAKHHIS